MNETNPMSEAHLMTTIPDDPLFKTRVQDGWVDYNGHMTEFRYLQVLGDATDAFLIHIGLDAGYRATGHSAYTVETHIRHLDEVRAGAPIRVETRATSSGCIRRSGRCRSRQSRYSTCQSGSSLRRTL